MRGLKLQFSASSTRSCHSFQYLRVICKKTKQKKTKTKPFQMLWNLQWDQHWLSAAWRSVTVCWQCWIAIRLFSRYVLFNTTLRDNPRNPARCNENALRWIHELIVLIFAYEWVHYFIYLLPLNDVGSVDLLHSFFQFLLCTMPHLLKSSRIKQQW